MAKQADTGVYQLKDGNWGYRFKVCINGKAIYKKCSKDENGNLFSSKRVAIEARKRAIKEQKQSAEKRMAMANASQSKTYGDVYREYCESGRKDRAYNTRKKQDSLWENHLEQRFGKRELTAVSTGEIRDYLTTLYGRKYNETKLRELEVEALEELRQSIIQSVREEMVKANADNAKQFAVEVNKAFKSLGFK